VNQFSQNEFKKIVPPRDKPLDCRVTLEDRLLSDADLVIEVHRYHKTTRFYLKKQSHRIAIFSTSF